MPKYIRFSNSILIINIHSILHSSSVGIPTELRDGRSGDRIPVGGKIFRTCPDRPYGPTSLLYNGYWIFPGCKEWPGRDADPSPPSSAAVKKGESYTSTPPIGRTACTEPQCLYSRAIPLLPL
jgi:hypothetical protein